MGVYFDTSSKGDAKGGVYGKSRRHSTWRAEIQVNKVRIRLGRFKQKSEAENAYELAKLKYRSR